MTTLKAFVSSTFTDLNAHRVRAIALLRGGGVHVDPMEDWSATSAEPKAFCLERMKDCSLCILLVAFRKGFIPDGETLSITQMEYQYALEHGIDVLPFLLDDGETSWPEHFDERETDPEIGRWRVRLRKKHGCGIFHVDPPSLDIGPAVLRWMQERQRKPGLTSPFDFASFLELKRLGFVGREWLFAKIEEWRTKRGEKSLLILGDPGIGKSAIVAELVHRQPSCVLAYHCCRADERSTLEPAKIVRALAAQVAQNLPEYAAKLSEDAIGEANCNTDPINAFGRGILAPLRELRAPQTGVRCLLFDALDEALTREERGQNLVEMLASRLNELPAWLRIVATARREDEVLEKLHGLQAMQLDAQDPRNRDDVRRYVEAHAAGAELQALLAEKSEGNFLYAREALEALRNEVDPLGALRSLPRGLRGIYPVFFERRFPDEESYKRARRVLQVMVAAREPLGELQLAEVTGLDEEEGLPRVLGRLEPFVVRRGASGSEGLTFYHKSLSDWLTDRSLRRSYLYASPKKGKERLAEWCLAEYRRGPRRMDGYALRHLPAHLSDAERWNELAAVLMDPSFLEANVERGWSVELSAHFRRAAISLPCEHASQGTIARLGEALAWDANYLSRHPTVLFQCLWNRCWWHARTNPGPRSEAPRTLVDAWRASRQSISPGCYWLRALYPPFPLLGETRAERFRNLHPGTADYSPTTGMLALREGDNIELWDTVTGGLVQTIKPSKHSWGSIFNPSVSADGKWVIYEQGGGWVHEGTVGYQGATVVTNVATAISHGMLSSSRVEDCYEDTEKLDDWAVFPDGQRLACLLTRSSIPYPPDPAGNKTEASYAVWDLELGKWRKRTSRDRQVALNLSFSPDSKHVAIAGWWQEEIAIWNLDTGNQIQALPGHQDGVWSVAYAPDARRLLSVAIHSESHGLRVWDIASGRESFSLSDSPALLQLAVFSPEGDRILGLSTENEPCAWNAQCGERQPEAPSVEEILALARGSCRTLFTAMKRADGMAIVCETTGREIAHFPVLLDNIVVHPSGRIWGGVFGRHVCLIALEGGDVDTLSPSGRTPE